ncbi:MAG: hypothetical protein AAF376_16365, partial [Pseudomonadota bacterium]
ARFLASTARNACDRNPYALLSGAHVKLIEGDVDAAYKTARLARLTAEGLPHAFAWDMEVCLTALGVGNLEMAHRAARAAHCQNPVSRPALRYLVALDLLRGAHDDARAHTAKLRVLEPTFQPRHLRKSDYPAMTLRATGYAERLPV